MLPTEGISWTVVWARYTIPYEKFLVRLNARSATATGLAYAAKQLSETFPFIFQSMYATNSNARSFSLRRAPTDCGLSVENLFEDHAVAEAFIIGRHVGADLCCETRLEFDGEDAWPAIRPASQEPRSS